MSRIEKILLIILILVAGIIPPAVNFIFYNVPALTVSEAVLRLQKNPENTLLLDVREENEFNERHMPAAVNIPYPKILENRLTSELIEELQAKTVCVLCESGIVSAPVTRVLRANNIQAYHIKGGLQEWIAQAGKDCNKTLCSLILSTGETVPMPFRPASAFKQWIAVFTGYTIKPLYTILSLFIAIILWKRKELEMKALKFAMIFFFVGENFCAANYLIYKHTSFLFEYLHSFGMLLCFGFVTYALFEGIDKYLVHYSDPQKKCSLTGLCRQCIKHQEVSCGLRQCFIFTGLALSLVALMPLCADFMMVSYNTVIWKTEYNYSHPVIHQMVELRYCPVLASVLFLSASLVLWLKQKKPVHTAKILFAAASGPMFFSFFRFILLHGYYDNLVWREFWEEITELIFITGVLFVLWVFRSYLFRKNSGKDAVSLTGIII